MNFERAQPKRSDMDHFGKSAESIEEWRKKAMKDRAEAFSLSLEDLESFSIQTTGETAGGINEGILKKNGEYLVTGNVNGKHIEARMKQTVGPEYEGSPAETVREYSAAVGGQQVSPEAAESLFGRFYSAVKGRESIAGSSFRGAYEAAEMEALKSVLGGDENMAKTAMHGVDISNMRAQK